MKKTRKNDGSVFFYFFYFINYYYLHFQSYKRAGFLVPTFTQYNVTVVQGGNKDKIYIYVDKRGLNKGEKNTQ